MPGPVRRMKPAAKSAPVQAGTQERGTATVRGEMKVGGEMRGSKAHETTLLERRFAVGEHPAFVRVGAGLTINTGNFESLRLDVSVSLPCLPSEVEDAYVQASQYTADFLAEEQSTWLTSKGRR